MARKRIDVLLTERGLAPSREQARALVLAGSVRSDGERITKAGHLVDEDAALEVAARPRFVSRGGTKLQGALDAFAIDVNGRRAIDVGASTGGFTDCLLQNGAASVVALDVGYGQLAWSLRTDDRVSVIERTNVRAVEPGSVGAPFQVVVCDVSFISLRVVMPHLAALLEAGGDLLALVKPQFEAGKGRVGKKGVVRDPDVHADVLRGAVEAAHESGLGVRGLAFSPVRGPEGNIEFWLWASPGMPDGEVPQIDDVVRTAHDEVGG